MRSVAIVAGGQNIVRGASQHIAGNRSHDAIREIARRLGRRPLERVAQNPHFRQSKPGLLALQQQQFRCFAISLGPDRQVFAVFLECFQKGR